MLVRKRQPYDVELLLFDNALQARRCFFLPGRPEPVTLDKTQRVTPLRRRSEAPSLCRGEVANFFRDLRRNRRRPRRAATPFDVDFHPERFPAARRADAVHGGRTLDAARMGVVE